jgi:HPt (histidine-containing phosphotransfer) domain-containing protein
MSGASSPLPPDLQQAMDLFRAQFAEQLPARLAEVRERLAAWQAAPADDTLLADLHRVLHRLAGSAGTFGMPAFGDACRAIESRLDELAAQPQRPAADVAQVAAQVAALDAPAGPA